MRWKMKDKQVLTMFISQHQLWPVLQQQAYNGLQNGVTPGLCGSGASRV